MMEDFLRSLKTVDLKDRCLFCLRPCGSEYCNPQEEELLRLVLSADGQRPGGFQRFFWKLLVGSFQSASDVVGNEDDIHVSKVNCNGGEEGSGGIAGGENHQRMPTCLTCMVRVRNIRRLHSDLEMVQMLLVEEITNLQSMVRNANAQVKDKDKKVPKKYRKLSDVHEDELGKLQDFQEKVIKHGQSVCKIPMVFLGVLTSPAVPSVSAMDAIDLKPICKLEEGVGLTTLRFEDSLNRVEPRRRIGRPPKLSLSVSRTFSNERTSRTVNNGEDYVTDEKRFCDNVVKPTSPPNYQDDGAGDSDWNPDQEEDFREQHEDDDIGDDEEYCPPTKRTVGRPRKNLKDPNAPKRPIGRPRKSPVEDISQLPKRRGRKPKVKFPTRPKSRPKNHDPEEATKKGKSVLNYRLKVRKLLPEPKERKKHHHNVFRCEICSKIYFKRAAFLKHKLAHREDEGNTVKQRSLSLAKNDDTNQCSVCQEHFHSSDYYEHLLTHEPNIHDGMDVGEDKKLFPCTHKDCIRKFRLEENLKIHEEIDHSELNSRSMVKVKKCDVCNWATDTSSALLEHMKRVHKPHLKSNPLVYCPVCGFVCTSNDNMLIHQHSHVTSEQQICFLCQSKHPNRSELLKHFRDLHNLQTGKECATCNEHFEDIYRYKIHLQNVHKRAETFVCSLCGKSCYFAWSFMAHFAIHTKVDIQGLPCPDCPEKFRNEDKLSNHRVKMHGAPKIPCITCGREYMNPSRWKNHQKEHTKEGFHCTICDIWYSNKARLIYHTAFKHSDERPFTCEVCGYGAKTYHQLNKHRATHEKKFQCEVCGRRFSRATCKRSHMAMHTGETVVCQFCGYEFHSKKSLKRHVAAYHTSENPQRLYPPQKTRRFCQRWKDADGNTIHAKNVKLPESESKLVSSDLSSQVPPMQEVKTESEQQPVQKQKQLYFGSTFEGTSMHPVTESSVEGMLYVASSSQLADFQDI